MKFSICDQKKKYETMKDTEDVIEGITRSLDELVEIDLSGNYFSGEAIEGICEVLKDARNLRIVNLSSVFLGLDKERLHHNLILLSNMLANHKIQKIDLSDNAISSDFPEEFGKFVSESTDLMHLKMNNCGLGKIGGNRLGECLKKIRNKNMLEIVDVAQNRFFSFPEVLSEALVLFDNIKELRLQYNTIEEETMFEFLRAFKNHELEVFDIRDNFLSPEGASYLGDLYCKWNLRELRVGDCMMGNEGVKDFLKKANTKLSPMMLPGDYDGERKGIILDISYNELEQDAMELLLEFCKKNLVKELAIFGNYHEDVAEIISVVKEQGGIVVTEEHLDISDSDDDKISESLMEKVAGL